MENTLKITAAQSGTANWPSFGPIGRADMPRVSAMLLPFLVMLAAAGAVDVLEGELPEDGPASCADGEECELHLLQSAALKVTAEVDAERQDNGIQQDWPPVVVKSRGIGQRLEHLLKKTIPKCHDGDVDTWVSASKKQVECHRWLLSTHSLLY